MEQRWNDVDEGKRNDSEKICPSVTLSSVTIDLALNPGFRREKSVTNPPELWLLGNEIRGVLWAGSSPRGSVCCTRTSSARHIARELKWREDAADLFLVRHNQQRNSGQSIHSHRCPALNSDSWFDLSTLACYFTEAPWQYPRERHTFTFQLCNAFATFSDPLDFTVDAFMQISCKSCMDLFNPTLILNLFVFRLFNSDCSWLDCCTINNNELRRMSKEAGVPLWKNRVKQRKTSVMIDDLPAGIWNRDPQNTK